MNDKHIEDKYALCDTCKKLKLKKIMISMWDDNSPVIWMCFECLDLESEKMWGKKYGNKQI